MSPKTAVVHKNMALTVSPAHTIQTDSTSSASLLKSSAAIIGSSICEPDNGGHHKHSATAATPTAYETGDLEQYENRLRTFENWPNNEMAPSRLAAAGFYYTKRTDVVKCPFCGTEGCQWQSEDNPLSDHLEWSPRCPFLLNLTRNSQSSSSAAGAAAAASTSAAPQDECGKYTNCLSETIPEALRKFAVDQTKPCSHPTFISLESRLKSFELWPKSLKQKPGDLAQAGFYYTGQGDQTLCFNCGGGLKDWEEQDVPWEQHALWFPKCTYLLLAKGRQYVEDVQSAEQQQQQQSSAAAGTSSAGSNNNNSNDSASAASTTDDLTKDERKPNDSDDLGSAASSSNSNPQNENSTTLCKICYRNEMSVMFLPCNHIVSCVDCAMSLRDSCPICRKKVQASFRVFLT